MLAEFNELLERNMRIFGMAVSVLDEHRPEIQKLKEDK